jgi:hypothetical protein
VPLDVGDALFVFGSDDVACQAEFADQGHRFRLRRNEAVRTALEQTVVPAAGFDHTA